MTAKSCNAFTALHDIEVFVRARSTLGFAEEAPLRMKAQWQARRVGEAWTGNLTPTALDARQHASMLNDLLTTFGSSERCTDWTTTCLAHIAKLRSLLVAFDRAPACRFVPFCLPSLAEP